MNTILTSAAFWLIGVPLIVSGVAILDEAFGVWRRTR